MAAVPPERLRIPAIKLYAGTSDPSNHLDLFASHMMVQDASDSMWCRVFSATLEGHARAWEALSIESFDQSVAMVAFQNALRPGRFAQSLAKTPPLTFTDALSQATKYINAEEVMQAKRAEHAENREKKKLFKEHKNSSRREKPRPRWDPSRYTPLTVPRAEILATTEGKDYLKKPLPMRAPSDQRDREKYCRFHRDHGHDTADCYQLKQEIQELINRGYLKKFIAREPNIRRE
ncbi:uncharacterized protein LOC127808678 [Diospyros lotus]|uniref:uncharacterized protein LOC127808678 n=1 Tax=Diospyros lotus TaxID=55363 RepID=UPI0022582D52|nr:uncharacterized protein LOC127808678 [Diospyros lotus]